jgi:branched-chain amino acid aminotransferase
VSRGNELYADRFSRGLEEVVPDLCRLDVYVNGRFVKGSEAMVAVWDHGFLYGDGVFEGIRAYDGKVFKLDEHLDRLFDSAKGIGLEPPLTKEELKEVILETLRRNRLRDAHIRPIITRGVGGLGLDPRKCPTPTVVVMAYPFPKLLGEEPIRLTISSVRRKAPFSIDAKIKSLNYLDSILAKLQAIVGGYDDAIMLDIMGYIAEASGENIFVVKRGELFTPPTTAALHGITRATVIELAEREGFKVSEKLLTPQDLYAADEVFLVGTATEVAPVAEIDGRKIGQEVPGPVTRRLMEVYQRYVRTEHVTPIPGLEGEERV